MDLGQKRWRAKMINIFIVITPGPLEKPPRGADQTRRGMAANPRRAR
jgi:hypothetical protein